MSSKQTRRSISVSGETYDRLKAYCEQHGRSMSGVCEAETIKFLDAQGVPASTVKKTISVPKPVVEAVVQPVKEVVPPPSRVETIREVVEAKKPPISIEALNAASKIFTF